MPHNTPVLPDHFRVLPPVAQALQMGLPVVALESAVITHGLPRPHNLNLARDVEEEVRSQQATPATIALIEGQVHVGLSPEQVEFLADADKTRKISLRDFGVAIARRESGGTTVAATLHAAHAAGIRVFATGGIGGVHRGNAFDISADLQEMSRVPLVIVCAGAKAILDLPATLEYLETMGVIVLGFQTDEFPAFYGRSSGLPVNLRVDSAAEVAGIARAQWEAKILRTVLVTVPPPADVALEHEGMEETIQKAIDEAEQKGVRGAAVTPFLLSRVSQLSGGASLTANLALLRQNARIAAQIAVEMAAGGKLQTI